MASLVRTNGIGNSAGGYVFQQGTVRYVAENLVAFLIDAQAALTNQDADSAGEVDQAIEAILREVQPVIYYSANTAQTITVICDGPRTAADLQARIRALGTLANGFNLATTTVVAASSLTAA